MSTPAPGARRPTPRPTFDGPTVIRRDQMTHHVWGDAQAAFVSDRVISSSDELHVLEFELPPGAEFRHSDQNQTIFAADVMYFCLQGELILANPQSGEVVRVPAGSGRVFRRGTWHHGFNPGQLTVRVIEYFSPPPARGAASEFARAQPHLQDVRYQRDPVMPWPMSGTLEPTAFWSVSEGDAPQRFRDRKASHLLATLVSTEYLQVLQGTVYAGHVEDFETVTRESVLYCLEGELWVDVCTATGGFGATAVLHQGEAMFLPVGCQQRLLVRDHHPARYLLGSGQVPSGWTP